MSTIDQYLLGLSPINQSIASLLREYILEQVPQVREKMAYGIPYFYLKKPFCYLHPHKDGGIDLSFARGYLLSNSQSVLLKRNRKYVRTLHYDHPKEIEFQVLHEILMEASFLDGESLK